MLHKIILLISLFLLTSCHSNPKQSLEKRLTWAKSKSKILDTLKKLPTNVNERLEYIIKELGNANLTHSIYVGKIPTSKYEFEYKNEGAGVAKKLSKKLEKDASFITINEVKNLKIINLSEDYIQGSFFVNNSCIKAKFIYIANKKDNQIFKMICPKKGSSNIKEGLILFDIKKK